MAVAGAAARDCRVVVLPECLDLGWTDPSALESAAPIPGPHSDRLSVTAGVEPQILVTAADFVGSSGHLRRRPRRHPSVARSGGRSARNREVSGLGEALRASGVSVRAPSCDCELGRVALTICADNLPGSLELGHALCRMGAQVIFSPSAWAVDADHDEAVHPYGAEWLHELQ